MQQKNASDLDPTDTAKPAGGGDLEIARTATQTGATRQSRDAGASAGSLIAGNAVGRYTITELLGEGGMGMVYAAHDPDLDRNVALKLLRRVTAGGMATRSDRQRLLREARAMARLSHPNVLTVYEVATDRDRDFIAMELVEGPSLDQWLKQKPRTWRQIVRLMQQAGRGLYAAHQAGLIHRDFKPSNILLREDGRVLVTDFGLARHHDDLEPAEPGNSEFSKPDAGKIALTQTGAVMGTPAYMAPEQHLGQADARSDQFSFCVTLYEALYGVRPFSGSNLDQLYRAKKSAEVADEPKGSGVPSGLRRVVLRGLHPDPDQRYPSMNELLQALSVDPRLGLRRAAAIALVALLVIGLIVGVRAQGLSSECRGSGDTQLAKVWDSDTKDAVRAAFSMTGVTSSANKLERLTRHLDEGRAAWIALYNRTCANQEDPEFAMRMSCLRDYRERVKSLTERLLAADATVVATSVYAAERLPKPERCGDREHMPRRALTPEDPKLRDQVESMRDRLLQVRVLGHEVWEFAAAQALAEEILAEARSTGYTPIIAEALYWLGALQAMRFRASEARATLQEAELLAQEAAHDRLHAEVLLALVDVEWRLSFDSKRWPDVFRRAEVALKRLGGDAVLQAELDVLLGLRLAQYELHDQADALLRSAIATFEARLDSQSAADVRYLLVPIAAVHSGHDAALELAEAAQATFFRELGPDHPKTVLTGEVLAWLLSRLGRADQARDRSRALSPYWQSERGQRYLRALGMSELSGDREVQGRVEDASGKPMAGVEVTISRHLVGDSKYAHASYGLELGYGLRAQKTVTDSNGRFVFRNVVADEFAVVAESDSGRSFPVGVSTRAELAPLTLELRPYGRLRGQVRRVDGDTGSLEVLVEPVAELSVSVSNQFVTHTGHYEFARLAAGRYTIRVRDAGSASRGVSLGEVEIQPDSEAIVDLDYKRGGISVRAIVKGKYNSDVGASIVVMVADEISPKTLGELTSGALARGSEMKITETPQMGSDRADTELHYKLSEVAAGRYTLCAAPIPKDFRDLEFIRSLQERLDELDVYCTSATIAEEPEEQTVVIEALPMKPFIESPLE